MSDGNTATMEDIAAKKEKGKPINAVPYKTPPATSPKSVDRRIYLGPTVFETNESGAVIFILKTATIYSNGLPKDIEARVNVDGQLAKMFVSVKDIPAAIRARRDGNSEFSSAATQVLKTFSGRRAKKGK